MSKLEIVNYVKNFKGNFIGNVGAALLRAASK